MLKTNLLKLAPMLIAIVMLGIAVSGQITLKQVNAAFASAKLPTGEIVIFDVKTDPNKLMGRPYGYLEKASWTDLSVAEGEDAACTVEVFKNAVDAKRRKKYIDEMSQASPLFVQYLYLHRNVLVRIAKAVEPDNAKKYETALLSVK